MNLPPGTSIANPIDAPVATLQQDQGGVANAILQVIYEAAAADAVVVHVNLAAFVGRGNIDPVDKLIAAAVAVHRLHAGASHLVIVLRVDGSQALEQRIPVYDELVEAADALRAVSFVEHHRASA